MNDFITYIGLNAVLNLYQGTLCKVDFYNFLDPCGSHAMPFIDSGNYTQKKFKVK